MTIPSSAAPGLTNEMVPYTPFATAATGSAPQGSEPHHGPIPNATQPMAYTGPNVHHIASSSQTLTSGSYQADFSRFKEDLAGVLKNNLGIDMGSSCLYQKPYPPEFDFVSYPAGWRVSETACIL